MVAVSAPGWTVSEHGGIVPDPQYSTDTELIVKPNLADESSECSECSGCGETSYSDGDSSSDEISEYMESSSAQSYVYQGPELEVTFEERPWKRPSPALRGEELFRLLDFIQKYGRLYEGMNATLKRFHVNGSPPDLINESFLLWLFVGVSKFLIDTG